MQLFLKDGWLSTLRSAIRSSLTESGKGWFNLEETNWEVYKISKLAKFMQLVNFAMQVTLAWIYSIKSTRNLCRMFKYQGFKVGSGPSGAKSREGGLSRMRYSFPFNI